MEFILLALFVAIFFEVAATMLLKPSNFGPLPLRVTLVVLFLWNLLFDYSLMS